MGGSLLKKRGLLQTFGLVGSNLQEGKILMNWSCFYEIHRRIVDQSRLEVLDLLTFLL